MKPIDRDLFEAVGIYLRSRSVSSILRTSVPFSAGSNFEAVCLFRHIRNDEII